MRGVVAAAGAAVLAAAALGCCAGQPAGAAPAVTPAPAGAAPAPPGGERATEAFRRQHVEIKEHLGHIHGMVGRLAAAPPAEHRDKMGLIVEFLKDHIGTHAAWEERALYPVVDRQAGGGAHPFTASMRHEHRIVERWIGELEQEAAKPSPDAVAFARRADNLLGLIWAHFEEEEEVLLPILDRTMTREQFEREVGSGAHGK